MDVNHEDGILFVGVAGSQPHRFRLAQEPASTSGRCCGRNRGPRARRGLRGVGAGGRDKDTAAGRWAQGPCFRQSCHLPARGVCVLICCPQTSKCKTETVLQQQLRGKGQEEARC